MPIWKKTMDYLGLGPDDTYDDYDEFDEPEPPARQRAPRDDTRGQRTRGPEPETTVRTVAPRPSFPSRDFDASAAARRPRPESPASHDDSGVQIRPNEQQPPPPQPALRSVPGGSMEPHTVRPRRFDQAQEVADKFKDGQPVIMNLEGTDRSVARRLIDFASGICYAMDGSMEKVATGVYLLKPAPQHQPRYDEYDD
ncbi:cell division protein SepF [uncultured Ilumatobacter sp.]|uniref:cell division protein SepF n=1 Tax=uncultured Ilumatobacter sp. TaxID=879968 RepID=UPI00374F7CE6